MDDQEQIRDDMDKTKTRLTEKLEDLETRVAATVEEATQEVAQTVAMVTDSVQDTVHTVKETVDDTLATVKGGVSAVQSIFDLPQHADRYPWVIVGGSVAFGFVLGEFLYRSHRSPLPRVSPSQDYADVANHGSNGHVKPKTEPSSNEPVVAWGLLDQIAPELSRLKGLALGALMGTVRDMIAANAGANLAQPLTEILDSMTKKLGGVPVPARSAEKNTSPDEKADARPANGAVANQGFERGRLAGVS